MVTGFIQHGHIVFPSQVCFRGLHGGTVHRFESPWVPPQGREPPCTVGVASSPSCVCLVLSLVFSVRRSK